ncbi:hypothetical protein TetV_571 [Tetraselmis virus 1]|uniref:Uncharacterized protein n=1 Tax=Tetraselmis virus 1 TaxID=2060617 RepID=A0A2P0VP23_9VIRU|nr:hypothetical protein QJ968_gp483 [Tetraselmis virus 1]AUF82653.1 hypothetical protein TetV_571 [Tetraselmis virus 1]
MDDSNTEARLRSLEETVVKLSEENNALRYAFLQRQTKHDAEITSLKTCIDARLRLAEEHVTKILRIQELFQLTHERLLEDIRLINLMITSLSKEHINQYKDIEKIRLEIEELHNKIRIAFSRGIARY